MQLRPYQETQLNFLKRKYRSKEVVGLESPTGSGKSFVITEYIKYIFSKETDKTVVISTGSNNLVFEFAETAKKFGLDPIIYVGSNLLTCFDIFDWDNDAVSGPHYTIDNATGDRIQIFSPDKSKWCSTVKISKRVVDEETGNLKICDFCRKCKLPHLKEIKEELSQSGNHLIITNHQAYLTHAFGDKPVYHPDIVIVDEAHMFSTFYSNWLDTTLDKSDINNIITALGNKPQAQLFKMFLERGEPLPVQLMSKIIDIVRTYYKRIPAGISYGGELCNRLSRFTFNDKNKADIFFDIAPDHMRRVKFWSKFEIGQDQIRYRLFTATLDRFTRIMFGMNPDDYTDNFYRETNFNIIDYTKSDAFIYRINDFDTALGKFIEICEKKDFKSGLILSTTIENVTNLHRQKTVGKYTVYTSLKDFKEADGYKVLVGSRAMFQGIDIPEINFVALNKIPFELYDEEFQKRTQYLKRYAGIDPWSDYSIPFVKNTIIQTTGRLWRGPDDYGIVGIFDSRLLGRFKYLMKTITDVRKGINVYVSGNDLELPNEEGFDDIVNDNIKE